MKNHWDQQKVHHKEQQIREWAFRSIVTIKDIKAGDEFSELNLWTKRPGTGIPSFKLPSVLGKKAVRDIPKDMLLHEDDIS